jgi:hypothetical protein
MTVKNALNDLILGSLCILLQDSTTCFDPKQFRKYFLAQLCPYLGIVPVSFTRLARLIFSFQHLVTKMFSSHSLHELRKQPPQARTTLWVT